MTIQEALAKAGSTHHLSPLDSGILLSLAIKKPKEYILARPEKNFAPAQIKKYLSFARRRSVGEPVAYIVGKKEFFGLDFAVNKNVLVPRPETELLVERVIDKINKHCVKTQNFASLRGNDKLTIIDLGTGSGNIIISIAKNIPKIIKHKINFYALDISKKSLQVSQINAKKYKLAKKIKFVQSDLLEYFSKNKIILTNIFIVANLPYVSPKIYQANKNNLKFEPKSALLSDDGGLNHYQSLFKQIKELLPKCCMSHVVCFVEFSPEQKPEISRIIRKYLPKSRIKFLKDLSGKWRVAEITT